MLWDGMRARLRRARAAGPAQPRRPREGGKIDPASDRRRAHARGRGRPAGIRLVVGGAGVPVRASETGRGVQFGAPTGPGVFST